MPHPRERVRNESSDLLVLVGDSDLLSQLAVEWMFSSSKNPEERVELFTEIKTKWPRLVILLNKAVERGELFGDFQLAKKEKR